MTDKQVLKTIGEDPASGKKLSRAAVWNLRLTTAASLGMAAPMPRAEPVDRGSDESRNGRRRTRAIRKDSGNLSRQHESMAR